MAKAGAGIRQVMEETVFTKDQDEDRMWNLEALKVQSRLMVLIEQVEAKMSCLTWFQRNTKKSDYEKHWKIILN